MNILIKNTTLITLNDKKEVVENIDIAIVEDKIKYIGNIDDSFIPDEVLDGTNKITMPGLINTHTHIPMSLFRNYADDLPFWEWLHDRILPLEKNLTGDHVYWGSMLSIAEMIKSGITSFVDMYFFVEDIAKAVEETGIRSFLSLSVTDGEENIEKGLVETKKFIKNFDNRSNGRINVRIAPHAPYSCSDEFLKRLTELSHKFDKGINIHVSESEKEVEDSLDKFGKTPVERLNDLGMLDAKTLAVHCVHLSDRDIEIFKEKNISVSNNPGSNLKLGNGFARINDLLDNDINVSLGTDGSASNNNLNMFEEMTIASLINKVLDKNPEAVPAYKALEMATINGARAINTETEIGSIEIDKKADIILIDLNKPHFYPRYNPVASLVYSAQASDVDTVIVNGDILMKDGKLLTIDIEDVMKNAEIKAKELLDN